MSGSPAPTITAAHAGHLKSSDPRYSANLGLKGIRLKMLAGKTGLSSSEVMGSNWCSAYRCGGRQAVTGWHRVFGRDQDTPHAAPLVEQHYCALVLINKNPRCLRARHFSDGPCAQ